MIIKQFQIVSPEPVDPEAWKTLRSLTARSSGPLGPGKELLPLRRATVRFEVHEVKHRSVLAALRGVLLSGLPGYYLHACDVPTDPEHNTNVDSLVPLELLRLTLKNNIKLQYGRSEEATENIVYSLAVRGGTSVSRTPGEIETSTSKTKWVFSGDLKLKEGAPGDNFFNPVAVIASLDPGSVISIPEIRVVRTSSEVDASVSPVSKCAVTYHGYVEPTEGRMACTYNTHTTEQTSFDFLIDLKAIEGTNDVVMMLQDAIDVIRQKVKNLKSLIEQNTVTIVGGEGIGESSTARFLSQESVVQLSNRHNVPAFAPGATPAEDGKPVILPLQGTCIIMMKGENFILGTALQDYLMTLPLEGVFSKYTVMPDGRTNQFFGDICGHISQGTPILMDQLKMCIAAEVPAEEILIAVTMACDIFLADTTAFINALIGQVKKCKTIGSTH